MVWCSEAFLGSETSLFCLFVFKFFVLIIILDTYSQALTEQWIDFASLEVDAHIIRWFYPRKGFGVFLPPVSLLDPCASFSNSQTFFCCCDFFLSDV